MSFKSEKYDDQEVIDIICKGKKQTVDRALKYLYKIHYPSVRKFVNQNSGSDEDAADIFQESMVVLYNHISNYKFQGKSTIKTYLFSIAKNLWLKELRKHPYKFKGILTKDHYTSQIDESVNESENIKILEQQIDKLGKECRKLLTDYYYSGLSMKDIRKQFGLGSEQAAKNKKYRCMQKLMKLCKDSGIKR